jgi:hypothetical protein
MAERRHPRQICLEYAFDRLLTAKLQQVYEILVPDRGRSTCEASMLTRMFHKPAKGAQHVECEGRNKGAELRLLLR